jgi:hypothetical protein
VYYSYSLCRRGTSISLARLSVTPPKCSSHTAEDLVPEERHQVYMPLRLIVYSRLDRPLEINDIFASLEDEAGTGVYRTANSRHLAYKGVMVGRASEEVTSGIRW